VKIQPSIRASKSFRTRFKDIVDSNAGTAIVVADLKGGRERRLTDWNLFGAHPDWSRTRSIVFNSYDLGAFQDTIAAANLYTIAPDGTGLQQITHFGTSDTRATQPRWTPDGSGIVFTRVDGEGFGKRRLAFTAADGSGLRWLTPDPSSSTHPQLRPLK
jgi:Tol biopolymer transport system component